MLFNSPEFLLFLPVVFALYVLSPHGRQNALLLAASYVFYGWWDVRFLMLILVSTVVDYTTGLGMVGERLSHKSRLKLSGLVLAGTLLFVVPDWGAASGWFGMRGAWSANWPALVACVGFAAIGPSLFSLFFKLRDEQRRRRAFLVASVVANLGILGFFKYFNFFIESASAVIAGLGGDPQSFRLDIVLPVGISFYTFQTMSYTIDVYRGDVAPTRSLRDFALYVAFFPQLVAGPIERARHLLPQITSPRVIRPGQFREGIFLIAWGLFKKVYIADGCAVIVNEVFGAEAAFSGPEHLIAVYAFAFQIYCDFSGYSDIARGVARLMGIDLMVNFNLPYLALNPSDFWRRWHISLSSWLRDYLYIPLGGNRGGWHSTYRNLFLTMLLGGLWHGATWTMIVWGAYHGLVLCAHRAVFRGKVPRISGGLLAPRVVLQAAAYFQVTCLGWLIFRATSMAQVGSFLASIFGDWHWGVSATAMGGELALLVAPLILVQLLQASKANLMEPLELAPARRMVVAMLGLGLCFLHWILFQPALRGGQDFIYFQF